MLRLTCIGGAIRSMTPRSSTWDIYFEIVGTPSDKSRTLLAPVTDFALAALTKSG